MSITRHILYSFTALFFVSVLHTTISVQLKIVRPVWLLETNAMQQHITFCATWKCVFCVVT